MVAFEVSRISWQDRVGFSNCLDLHMHYLVRIVPGQCFQFSSPNLQWLTRFDFKEPLSALWLAQLVYQFNLWRPWTYLW